MKSLRQGYGGKTPIVSPIAKPNKSQVGEEPKATITTVPKLLEATRSLLRKPQNNSARRSEAPAGDPCSAGIQTLLKYGFCSSGERESAKKRCSAFFTPVRRLHAVLQNRFRRPAAGATAGSCSFLG